MRELLDFLVQKMTGITDYEVEEKEDNGYINYEIKANSDDMGLLIGKNGKTVRTIRTLLKVRAILQKKAVSVSVTEKAS